MTPTWQQINPPRRNIIFYELNEVAPNLLMRYIKQFPNSSLAKIFPKSSYYDTVTTDVGSLSPWITWPTLHRGVNNQRHKISDFGQNLEKANRTYPNYFDILARNKIRVGVFGSLQSFPIPNEVDNYSFYIPDSFAGDIRTHPKNIESFQKLNLYMTSKNGRNIKRHLPILETMIFLKEAPRVGLSLETIKKIFLQLVNETFNRHLIVRRRTTQAQISFDIFLHLLSAERPSLATFFTNHVASSMHRYWPATFPEDYIDFKMPIEWIQKYNNEIWYTMHETDYQILRLLGFIQRHPYYSLVISSSMGQGPIQRPIKNANQLYLTSPRRLFDFLGIPREMWSQRSAMAPQYIFHFEHSKYLANFKRAMEQFVIRSEVINYSVLDDCSIRLSFGHENFGNSEIVLCGGTPVKIKDIGLEIVDIQDKSGSYAYHIPEGILLIYNGARKAVEDIRVRTTDIAPSLLKHFNVPIPDYMDEGYYLF